MMACHHKQYNKLYEKIINSNKIYNDFSIGNIISFMVIYFIKTYFIGYSCCFLSNIIPLKCL